MLNYTIDIMRQAMQLEIGNVAAQKSAGDEAFRAGQLEEALSHYSAALQVDFRHVPTLCNRSLAALKLGLPEEALHDAEAALAAISAPAGGGPDPASSTQFAKAVHRKAEALAAMGQLIECLQAYRHGLAACPGCPELHAALRLASEELPVGWLAKYWARHVEAAQQPNPLSSRDGRLVKPVPAEQRLAPPDLQAHLEAALYPLQDEARDLLCAAWALGRLPGRAEAAFMRAAAYLNAGNAQQAVKDARLALVYGPQLEPARESSSTALVAAPAPAPASGSSSAASSDKDGSGKQPAAPPPPPALEAAGKHSGWPAALGLLSGALEGLAENVPAALAVQRAMELDPENEEYAEARERLLRRIPEPCAVALKAGGAAGLEAHLAVEREAALPEFRKQRPKYYYYYEWMKKRIYGQYPELPEPVMDKLLALEANELDMVLQYPRATQITVERLMGVYEREGAEKLEGYEVPLLSWEDYEAIKQEGGAMLALPAGDSSAPAAAGRLLGGGSGSASSSGNGSGANRMDTLPAPAQGAAAGAGTAEAGAVPTGLVAAQAAAAATEDGEPEGGQLEPGQAAEEDAASEAGSIDIDELFELD